MAIMSNDHNCYHFPDMYGNGSPFYFFLFQWTKDDFGLGTHRNLSGFERYSMVGSDEEGDFSLDIFPVMLDDDAKYQCQVGPGRKGRASKKLQRRRIKLTFLPLTI